MPKDIREAYAIYERITCQYEDLHRIPEIFTDDVVGGNAVIGRIRGLEAQTIFLTTARETGAVPEDHLWCMIDGDDLAFRARNWAGRKHDSPFFDMIGHLIFDRARGKFCFYYGFMDPNTAMKVMGSSSVAIAAPRIQAMHEATRRFESRPGFDAALSDRMLVSSLEDGLP